MTLKTEILHLVNIIASPTEVYEDIGKSPRWKAPLLFTLMSSLVVGWFMIPAIMEPMRKIFISSFGEDTADAAIKGVMKSMLIVQLLIEPLFKLVRWLVFAMIVYLILRVYTKGDSTLLKRIFSAVAYTESIFILMSTLTVLIIYIRGIDSIEAIGDLTFFKGLDFFLKGRESNSALVTILSNINPFSVWYVVTIAFGIRVFTQLRKSKTIIIASVSWFIWIAVSILQAKATALLLGLITGQS